MSKVMTREEIEAEYEGEWILIGDPQTDVHHQVLSGTVLCHSKDRDEVYEEADRLKPTHFAMIYTGTIPEDMAIVL